MPNIVQESIKCISENCTNKVDVILNPVDENDFYCDECRQALFKHPTLVSIKQSAKNLTLERKEKFIADFACSAYPAGVRSQKIKDIKKIFNFFFDEPVIRGEDFGYKTTNDRNLPIECLGVNQDAYKAGWRLFESGKNMEMECYCSSQKNAKFESTVQGYAGAEFLHFVETYNGADANENIHSGSIIAPDQNGEKVIPDINLDALAGEIEKTLFEIKDKVFYYDDDFKDACLRITLYFLKNEIPRGEMITTKKTCKQKLASAMGKIWIEKRKHIPITREYLLLYKSLFSIFANDEIEEGDNVFNNNLYKYSLRKY